MGSFSEGERIIEKGLSFARDVDNLGSLTLIVMLYGVFFSYMGDAENQVKHWRSSIDYMEKGGGRIFLGVVWAW